MNGWLNDHDKYAGARWAFKTLLCRDLAPEMDRWVIVGDSTNDQLMFEAFGNNVGVANVQRFEAALVCKPAYVAAGERGAGFAEVVKMLLSNFHGNHTLGEPCD